MPPGTDTVIDTAAASGDWVATALVWLMVAILAIGFMGFQHIKSRQNKQDERQEKQEEFQRTTMADVIDDNTIGWGHFGVVLNNRPCIKDSDAIRITERTPTPNEVAELPESAARAYERRQERLAAKHTEKRQEQSEEADD